jgi:hypothetical protein
LALQTVEIREIQLLAPKVINSLPIGATGLFPTVVLGSKYKEIKRRSAANS